MKIIACDFDGTICQNKYPEIGEPKISVIEQLKAQKELGTAIILWSCREGKMLEDAIEWCKQFGLIFDAVNENISETRTWMEVSSRKVYATEYWDDRAVKID